MQTSAQTNIGLRLYNKLQETVKPCNIYKTKPFNLNGLRQITKALLYSYVSNDTFHKDLHVWTIWSNPQLKYSINASAYRLSNLNLVTEISIRTIPGDLGKRLERCRYILYDLSTVLDSFDGRCFHPRDRRFNIMYSIHFTIFYRLLYYF